MDPRDFAAELATKVERCRIGGQSGEGRPKLKLVALAVTGVAVVSAQRYVDGEGRFAARL